MNDVTVNLGSIPVKLVNALPQGAEKVNVYNYATLIGARGIEYYDGLIKQMADEVLQNSKSLNAVNGMKNWQASDWDPPTPTTLERNVALQAMGLIDSAGMNRALITYTNSLGESTQLTTALPTQNYSKTYAEAATDPHLRDGQEGDATFTSSDNVTFVSLQSGGIYRATSVQPFVSPSPGQIADWQAQSQDLVTKLTQISQKEQAQMQDLIASYNKFMNFTSNLQERKERDLMSVIDHF